MPLMRRMPKRGFNNISRKEYAIVNLDQLNKFDDGTTVSASSLKEAGIIKRNYQASKFWLLVNLIKKLLFMHQRLHKLHRMQSKKPVARLF